MFKVIGLTGAARSGKDTVADHLVWEHDFIRIAWAEPIKAMVCAMLNVNRGWIEQNKEVPFDSKIPSPRVLMQTLGTEWGREVISPTLWIDLGLKKLQEASDDGFPGAVVTDCRFNNEAAALFRRGAHMWHITRPDVPAVNPHASEKGIKAAYIDQYLVNDGTIEDLWESVEKLL